MPDVKLARAPVEPGMAGRLRDWYAELHERADEVVETLRHEGVLTESAFLREDDGTAYLYVYMEAAEIEAAIAAGAEEAYDVDEEHHEVLGAALAGDWEDLEPIGHYANPTRG